MSAKDYYMSISDGGQLMLHIENDGWTFLRRGPERQIIPISRKEALDTYPTEYRNLLKSELARAQMAWDKYSRSKDGTNT